MLQQDKRQRPDDQRQHKDVGRQISKEERAEGKFAAIAQAQRAADAQQREQDADADQFRAAPERGVVTGSVVLSDE